jgi:GNAT superfamily N-acetyltransferase
MLFATASLVRRIEEAEASLIAGFGRSAARRVPGEQIYLGTIGGGTAVAAGPQSPISKIAGLGFEPLDEAALEGVEQEFARRATPVRAEVASLADPSVGALLTKRGYVLSGFENVLGLALDSLSSPATARPVPAISVTRITPAESAAWLDAVVTGFIHPDTFDAPPSDDVVDRQALDDLFAHIGEVDGLVQYVARRDGEIAGGGSLRIWNGVAQLCGAATVPHHRRRGVQTSLLRERLAEAQRGGCDVAVVTTQPGSNSQQSTERQGFALMYVRAILIKGSGHES